MFLTSWPSQANRVSPAPNKKKTFNRYKTKSPRKAHFLQTSDLFLRFHFPLGRNSESIHNAGAPAGGGRGEASPPPETKKIVVEKLCYFPELYKMTKIREDGIENG